MEKERVLLVKVNPETLAERAQRHLYTAEGRLCFSAGHVFPQEGLQDATRQPLYRDDQSLPNRDFLNHEGYVLTFDAGLTEGDRQQLREESEADSLFSTAATDVYMGSLACFLQRIKDGVTPDIALCEVLRDRMIAEVTSQVEQIQFLSQIRIRDEFTYAHILDVTALSIALAIRAGYGKREVREIALAAILHDLGKLLIPRSIMFKPTRLTEKEFRVMQLHPELGRRMIVETLGLPDDIGRPALEHQEMYGGGGYPQGLKGDEIHPYSHVVKIADVYDALTSKRPYKEAIPGTKAIQIMLSEGEKSFHPELLAQFAQLGNHGDPVQNPVQADAL